MKPQVWWNLFCDQYLEVLPWLDFGDSLEFLPTPCIPILLKPETIELGDKAQTLSLPVLLDLFNGLILYLVSVWWIFALKSGLSSLRLRIAVFRSGIYMFSLSKDLSRRTEQWLLGIFEQKIWRIHHDILTRQNAWIELALIRVWVLSSDWIFMLSIIRGYPLRLCILLLILLIVESFRKYKIAYESLLFIIF